MDFLSQTVTLCAMTVTTSEAYGAAVAAEIRAWTGRRGWTQVRLSEELGEDQIWVSRRLKCKVRITVEDLAKFAQALDCSVADLLPRLDSNQQPSESRFAQVSALGAAA